MPKPAWVLLPGLHEVECLLAAAETFHFRSAAEYLHLPQPHLNRRIRRLEGRTSPPGSPPTFPIGTTRSRQARGERPALVGVTGTTGLTAVLRLIIV
jgi:Bacterial regulatory helix-turn-helix protein, lysR family